MSDGEELPDTGAAGGRVHILQPSRDLQSNWELDLAKSLEEYLLKICSGEISDAEADHAPHSVNFAEAALLLQGSVQVYSRKVEYLYSLVLHALEFLSQKRQDQEEKSSVQNEGSGESNAVVEENEPFLGLDDVPVDLKNCLDAGHNHGDSSSQFVKPPANLLVLEGDCLDTSGAAGELESYLLATCDFYGDFLLLDPRDAGAVYKFLKTDAVGREHFESHRGSSARSRKHQSVFQSPNIKSLGTALKSCLGNNEDVNLNQASQSNSAFETNNDNIWSPQQQFHSFPEDDVGHADEPNVGSPNFGDDSDDDNDDPWKPLNPHEPGNLKIKPYKKGKTFGRQVFRNSRRNTLSSQFPIAKLDGFICQEFADSFEVKLRLQEMANKSESPPLYEKLRRSLAFGLQESSYGFDGVEDENDENSGDNDIPDFEQAEFDPSQEFHNMETDPPLYEGQQSDSAVNIDGPEGLSQDSNASLEDLCRSHLDSLLASIAESEKQTEMAARVSTWKQRIEHNLEEQDAHPPFDIHLYGERILDKLSSEVGSGGSMTFTNVVRGQPKHDVARTFSALLQLVNNGNVELQRPPSSGSFVCYTGSNPFHVRLLRHQKRREESHIPSAKKKVKMSPKKRLEAASPRKSSHQNGRTSIQIRKNSIVRCTPEGNRQRRSRISETDDMNSVG